MVVEEVFEDEAQPVSQESVVMQNSLLILLRGRLMISMGPLQFMCHLSFNLMSLLVEF